MEKVCGMTWIGDLFIRFQKEPADELSSQHWSAMLSMKHMDMKTAPGISPKSHWQLTMSSAMVMVNKWQIHLET